MPCDRLESVLEQEVSNVQRSGAAKGEEHVIVSVVAAANGKGPRFRLGGCGAQEFLRMNSNSYLGLSFHNDVIAAGETAVKEYGTGPGAVRFISGTWRPHKQLESRLAAFHGRDQAGTVRLS